MKAWSWILLITTVILIKIASTQSLWIEENYSNGIYRYISKFQRSIFGWIPFSIGDLFYAFLVLVIIFKTVQFIKYIFKKKVNRLYLLSGLKQVIFFFLFVYLFFYGLWGLNYNRKGISYQLNLEMKKYSLQEIDTLTDLLQQRLNFYADTIDLKQRDSFNKRRSFLKKLLKHTCMPIIFTHFSGTIRNHLSHHFSATSEIILVSRGTTTHSRERAR